MRVTERLSESAATGAYLPRARGLGRLQSRHRPGPGPSGPQAAPRRRSPATPRRAGRCLRGRARAAHPARRRRGCASPTAATVTRLGGNETRRVSVRQEAPSPREARALAYNRLSPCMIDYLTPSAIIDYLTPSSCIIDYLNPPPPETHLAEGGEPDGPGQQGHEGT